MIPLALQNLLNTSVQIDDVAMLSFLDDIALSASNLGGQPAFIISLALFGLSSGMMVLTSQYWGKRDLEAIEKVLGISVRFALCLSFGFFLVCFFLPVPIMHIFSSEAEVIRQGADYLRILSISFVFSGFNTVYLFLMRSIQRVGISTFVYVTSLFINIGCNYVLIFGKLGLPALGVTGAAIGTVIARVCETAILLVYNARFNNLLRFRPRVLLIRNRMLTRDFFRYSSPVILNEVLWGGGTAAVNAILGQLGSTVTAASTVAGVVKQLALVLCMGVGATAAIVLGENIGKSDIASAERNGKRFIFLAAATGLLGFFVIFLLRLPVVAAMKNLSELSRDYLNFMLIILSIIIVFQSINCTIVVGVLRAGGDTRVGLLIDVCGLWICSILFGSIAAFVFELPVKTVYCILVGEEILKLCLCLWRWHSGKWLRNITREKT